jgi:hypothetical protein
VVAPCVSGFFSHGWPYDPRTDPHKALCIRNLGSMCDKQKIQANANMYLILNCPTILLSSGTNPEPAGPSKKSERLKEETSGPGGAGTC